MMRVTVEDTDTGRTAHADIAPDELGRISGVQLAAALFPNPTDDDAAAINGFLEHYRSGAL